MIKLIYQYFLKIKAFNKLFIIYAVIMVTALLLLSSIVSYSLTSMVLKREMKYNHLILSSVKTYFEDNFIASKQKQNKPSILSIDKNALTKLIKQNYEMKYGSILILRQNGKVLYDSSNTYNNSSYPIHNFKSESSTYKINNKEYIIGILKSTATSTIIVGILPVDLVIRDMQDTKSLIFFVALVFILAGILITYFSKTEYQKRVQLITDAMKKVHQGNLSARIPVSNYQDEINEITVGFNDMCDNLEKYIDKVYLADIKQKKAELMALQAQINPHFLYNTLEVIRMSASLSGAEETSDMIQILAKLFRNVVRMDTIIDIDDEIRHCKLYLSLFNLRYGDNLSIIFDIDPEILGLGIIKHLIQPVMENYIVHGFDINRSDNLIKIQGLKENKYIVFIISDNGKGIDTTMLYRLEDKLSGNDFKKRDSIGLLNVNDRIRLIYDENCGIEISSSTEVGTTVKIKILAKTKKELEEYV